MSDSDGMSKVLGVDPGGKRSGVAISDGLRRIAFPLATASGMNDALVSEIKALVDEHGASEVVVGLPKHLNGAEGAQAAKVRELVKKLKESLDVEVHVLDERLTTVGAVAALREGGMSAKKQRLVVDKIAATLLLQGYLDSRQTPSAPSQN